MIRILIADDEAPARTRSDCEIATECSDGTLTLEAMLTQEFDVLFIDIQMPELTGFEVLAHLPENHPRPAIIFTTAYDEHALEAFSVCAVDYLLKPWKEERLHAALDRAIATREAGKPSPPGIDQLVKRVAHLANERLPVRDGDKLHFLRILRIDHIESDGNYVTLHHRGRRHLHRETLSALEQRLASHGFLRVNRSHLVNLSHIREISAPPGGPNRIILDTDAIIPLTQPIREIEQILSSHHGAQNDSA